MKTSMIEEIKANIRTVANFPKEGIIFRDITPVLADGELLRSVVELMSEKYAKNMPSKVVGIESRGFILGVAIAYVLGVGFVPVRKKGKLPYDTYEASYNLEYGQATLAIHKDALVAEDRVLIVDDLLATGGTVCATIELIKKFGSKILAVDTMIELTDLKGRERIKEYDTYSLFTY